jgi:hypothetical protein
MRNPTLGRARAVFGRPTSQVPVRRYGMLDCALSWNRLGLTAYFTTLGIAPGVCNPNKQLDVATITGRKWRTWGGLQVGDIASKLRNDPTTTFSAGEWWLASVFTAIGSGGDIPTVTALTRHGRIAKFRLYVHAQGE